MYITRCKMQETFALEACRVKIPQFSCKHSRNLDYKKLTQAPFSAVSFLCSKEPGTNEQIVETVNNTRLKAKFQIYSSKDQQMRSGLMRLKLRPEFNHNKKANNPPNPKPLVLLPCSPLQLQSQLQEGCRTLEQLSPVLARLLVSGILCQSLSLCKLVEFLSLSRNSTFLLYARLLVETHRLSSSRDQGEAAFTVSSTTTFLWNTLIKGYSRTQFPQQGLIAYSKMIHKSSKPDNFTFPFVVKAASSVREGTQVHGHILSNGFDSNVFVVNTLLNMYAVYGDMESAQRLFDLSFKLLDIVSWNTLIDGYAKSGAVDLAQQLFDRMPEKNEISWTAMISGYAKSGDLDVAQSMFDRMPICRNTVTWNSMISGFAKCGFSSLARKLFDEMPFRNIVSWNSMISSYAQNGELDLARSLFDEMPEKDVFSWSCMISGYAQNGRGRHALELFKEMQSQGHIRPNEVTLISVLSVCGHLAALDQGKWIHAYIERNGMALSDNLGASLIDMYAKCGYVKTSVEVFQKLEQKNVSTWNALIVGLAINGVAHGALEAFAEMQRLKTKPNNITFLGVLMACCHSGLADEGRRQFRSMSKIYGIQPEMKHYGCVVDMLGRAGLLEEAEEIVRSMPMKPDIMVLGALISACRIHGDLKIADRLRRDFLELKSQEAGCHVLFSNIYASAGRWADALDMRSILNLNQIRKEAGLSSVKSLEFESQTDVSIDGCMKSETLTN